MLSCSLVSSFILPPDLILSSFLGTIEKLKILVLYWGHREVKDYWIKESLSGFS